jgi:hypothetical protein
VPLGFELPNKSFEKIILIFSYLQRKNHFFDSNMQILLHQLRYGAAVVLGRKICNPMATTCHQASRSAPVHVDDGGGGFCFMREGAHIAGVGMMFSKLTLPQVH